MTTWIEVPEDSPFPATNLPYGVFCHGGEAPRVGVALGDQVVDLAPLAAAEGLDGGHVFEAPTLNPFLALGRPAWAAVRSWLAELLEHEGYRDLVESHLVPQDEVTLHLPFEVADYVDFYSSEHHAENVGRIFRPDGERAHAQLEAPARSATTAGPAPSSSRAPTSCGRSGQRKAAGRRRPVVRPVGAPRHRGRGRLRGRRAVAAGHAGRRRRLPASTSSASAWSTTGAPATSRPGSTCRSGRSWASRSPPRCRPGWCRSTRCSTARVAGPVQEPAVLPYLQRQRRLGPRPVARGVVERHGRVAAAVRRRCTGRRTSSWPT